MECIENVCEKLMAEYPDLIYQTQHRDPNYEEIHFDRFLERKFNNSELFRDRNIKVEIDNLLEETYGKRFHKHKIFRERGKIVHVLFRDLKYYQQGVGIRGSISNMNSPVLVVKYKSEAILYDGYHRALQTMANDEEGIDALILSI
jgi:hypothetical protein